MPSLPRTTTIGSPATVVAMNWPGLLHLIGARNELPRLAEHVQALKFRDARIDIPGGGDGRSLRQRGAVVVTGEYLLD